MVKLRIRLDIKIGKKEMEVVYPDNIDLSERDELDVV